MPLYRSVDPRFGLGNRCGTQRRPSARHTLTSFVPGLARAWCCLYLFLSPSYPVRHDLGGASSYLVRTRFLAMDSSADWVLATQTSTDWALLSSSGCQALRVDHCPTNTVVLPSSYDHVWS